MDARRRASTRINGRFNRPGLIDLDSMISKAVVSRNCVPITASEKQSREEYRRQIQISVSAYEQRVSRRRRNRGRGRATEALPALATLEKSSNTLVSINHWRVDQRAEKSSVIRLQHLPGKAYGCSACQGLVSEFPQNEQGARTYDTAANTREHDSPQMACSSILDAPQIQKIARIAVSRMDSKNDHLSVIRSDLGTTTPTSESELQDPRAIPLDLNLDELSAWENIFLPAWCACVGARSDPCEISTLEILKDFEHLWRCVYPGKIRQFDAASHECILASVAIERWALGIRKIVDHAVKQFFEDTYGRNYELIRWYAARSLREVNGPHQVFMWRDNNWDNPLNFQGFLLPTYILAGVQFHLLSVCGLPPHLYPHEYPKGALILSLAAAKQTIQTLVIAAQSISIEFDAETLLKDPEFTNLVRKFAVTVQNLGTRRWTGILETIAEISHQG